MRLRPTATPDVPVQGVLCFTTADLPLFGTLKMRGHLLLHRKALAKRLNASGPLGPPAIEALADSLAAVLRRLDLCRESVRATGRHSRGEAQAQLRFSGPAEHKTHRS